MCLAGLGILRGEDFTLPEFIEKVTNGPNLDAVNQAWESFAGNYVALDVRVLFGEGSQSFELGATHFSG